MLFNSWQFAVFLPVVFILYWILPHRFRKAVLLVSSLFFYMCWRAKYVVLLFCIAGVTYGAALIIEKAKNRTKKFVFVLAITACASMLFVFKYLDFSFHLLQSVFSYVGIVLHPRTLQLMMPLGISFFTFQGIGYVADVYHSRIAAEKNPATYLLFISFFPQISSGPIARAGELIPQLEEERVFSIQKAEYAVRLMIWGFFKKMVIADNFAVYVDRIYASPYDFSGFPLLIAVIMYSVQLYCDFSGYTDIARACACFFGVDLSENFKAPYLSLTVKEFWSRWHISLSSWLRDYVYIPLGGSRKGKIRTQINLLITFFISGLWHGADVTFIVWGLIHAGGQIIENVFHIRSSERRGISSFARKAIVFSFVSFAWIFFRADSLADAAYIVKNMFCGIRFPAEYFRSIFCSSMIAGESFAFIFRFFSGIIPVAVFDRFSEKRDIIQYIGEMSESIRFFLCLMFLVFIFLFRASSGVSFVYFQF